MAPPRERITNLERRPTITYTDNHTVTAADIGAFVLMNKATALTLTLPADATATIPVGAELYVVDAGAGDLTIAAASGATLNGVTSMTTAGNGCLIKKTAANTWWAVR